MRVVYVILIIWLVFLTGCESVVETPIDISGRYDNEEMVLYLSVLNQHAEADLVWSGKVYRLLGTYHNSARQLVLGCNAISFDLIYKDKLLAGWQTIEGSEAVRFYYRDKLTKSLIHQQGGLQ